MPKYKNYSDSVVTAFGITVAATDEGTSLPRYANDPRLVELMPQSEPPEPPTPDYTSVRVRVIWPNKTHKETSTTVQLYQDGGAYGDPVTLSSSDADPIKSSNVNEPDEPDEFDEIDSWIHDFTQLPADHVYTVSQLNLPAGYTAVSLDAPSGCEATVGTVLVNWYTAGDAEQSISDWEIPTITASAESPFSVTVSHSSITDGTKRLFLIRDFSLGYESKLQNGAKTYRGIKNATDGISFDAAADAADDPYTIGQTVTDVGTYYGVIRAVPNTAISIVGKMTIGSVNSQAEPSPNGVE